MTNIVVGLDQLRVQASDDTGQMTLPAGENLAAGDAVYIVKSSTGAGTFKKAKSTDAASGNLYGVAWKDTTKGLAVTAIRRGVVDGYTLDALDYWGAVYLSDTPGLLADTAGTVSVLVGHVVPVHAQSLGKSPGKLLLVEVGNAADPA